MKRRGHTTWWDLAEELDVLICDNGPAGCQSNLSQNRHKVGTVKDGIIHWEKWGRRSTIKGLRTMMILVAYAKNPQFLEEPDWLGLYHADRWAFYEELRVFGLRVPWEHTVVSRKEVKRRAKKARVSLRRDHDPIFWWANWKPDRATIKAPVRGSLNG